MCLSIYLWFEPGEWVEVNTLGLLWDEDIGRMIVLTSIFLAQGDSRTEPGVWDGYAPLSPL